MANLKLCFTQEDKVAAERYKTANPVLLKLENTTGTLWRFCSDDLAMETMSPFRTTLLPSWALRGWYTDSYCGRTLPCELDLELYSSEPNDGERQCSDGKTDKNESANAMTKKCTLDYETIQNALLQVLEYNEWSRWRAVCPHIFIECDEPFRTIVLSTEMLRCTQGWLQSLTQPLCFPDKCKRKLSEMTPIKEPALRLAAKLHASLSSEAIQDITINFPPRTF